MILDTSVLSLGGKPWRITGPAALVEQAANLVPVEKNTVFTVYTNNMRVVAGIAMSCPLTGDQDVDDVMWTTYLETEWALFRLAMSSEEATIPDAVWYVIFGYRPSRQTDTLRSRPDVLDICMVHDQRMWSLLCNDPKCDINDHSPAGFPVNVPGLSTID